MTKSFIKNKSGQNQAGPKFRTPDYFKGSKFAGTKTRVSGVKFNPAQFKTQHKG